jgi:hypothetical protein
MVSSSSSPDDDDRRQRLDELAQIARTQGARDAVLVECGGLVIGSASPSGSGDCSFYDSPAFAGRDDVAAAVAAFTTALVVTVDPAHPHSAEELFRITGAVESACFYRGFHLAMAVADADCRSFYCGDEAGCALLSPGERCRHPYRARPMPRALGMDVSEVRRLAGLGDDGALLGMVFIT